MGEKGIAAEQNNPSELKRDELTRVREKEIKRNRKKTDYKRK